MGSIKEGIKFSLFKSMVNVKGWIGWENIKRDTSFVSSIFQNIFSRKPQFAKKETFEEAMLRFGLTDEDLKNRSKELLFEMWMYLIIGLFFVGYTCYLFFSNAILSGITSIMLFMLCLILAYGAHFKYFQIKHKKLGCTFKEWFEGKVFVEKSLQNNEEAK